MKIIYSKQTEQGLIECIRYDAEDGPALEYANGDKFWYLQGKRHRTDGPAVEDAYGYKAWYLNGKQIFCRDNDHFLKLMQLKAFW